MDETMVIRSSDSVFLNSKCIFIEYIDIIKSPYFLLLYLLTQTDQSFKEPFNVDKVKPMSVEELGEWYYSRRHQNFLVDLIPDSLIETVNLNDVDIFLDSLLKESPELINFATPLNMVNVVTNLMYKDSLLVPKVLIYYPYENDIIKRDIEKTFLNPDIQFVSGDISDVLKEVPNDSTYIFSDISNILILEELGKIDMSSIIIPEDYDYNKTEEGEYILDLESMQSDHVFKLNFFLASVDIEDFGDDE